MRTYLSVIAMAVLAACGGAQSPENGSSVVGVANADSSASAASAAGGTFANRKGELLNPDDSTIVFLYYDLSGMQPPITDWVEQDNRVQFAPGLDKAARRDAVKKELEAAAAAVQQAVLEMRLPDIIQAEFAGWELARVRMYRDGTRQVVLRRVVSGPQPGLSY